MAAQVENMRYAIVDLLIRKDCTLAPEELLRQAKLLENYIVKGEST